MTTMPPSQHDLLEHLCTSLWHAHRIDWEDWPRNGLCLVTWDDYYKRAKVVKNVFIAEAEIAQIHPNLGQVIKTIVRTIQINAAALAAVVRANLALWEESLLLLPPETGTTSRKAVIKLYGLMVYRPAQATLFADTVTIRQSESGYDYADSIIYDDYVELSPAELEVFYPGASDKLVIGQQLGLDRVQLAHYVMSAESDPHAGLPALELSC